MKIVSFNINSIRARPHQIEYIRDAIDPDVIGLQETKVNDPDFPLEIINDIGYHVEYHGQKGHYGVAILSKSKPINVIFSVIGPWYLNPTTAIPFWGIIALLLSFSGYTSNKYLKQRKPNLYAMRSIQCYEIRNYVFWKRNQLREHSSYL